MLSSSWASITPGTGKEQKASHWTDVSIKFGNACKTMQKRPTNEKQTELFIAISKQQIKLKKKKQDKTTENARI